MPLVNVVAHHFVRLIKFARLLFRSQLTDDLLEHFHRFETAFAFEAFDVQLHAAVLADGDVKFALGHKLKIGWFRQQSGNFFFKTGCVALWVDIISCPHIIKTEATFFIH